MQPGGKEQTLPYLEDSPHSIKVMMQCMCCWHVYISAEKLDRFGPLMYFSYPAWDTFFILLSCPILC